MKNMIQFYYFLLSDIIANLKNNKLSLMQVEDWKVTILSYDLFPTVPLTFDEMYWEAYWPIVNEPLLDVRKVMMKRIKKEKRMR